MTQEERARTIVDLALAHASGKVDDIEITISRSTEATSRFAVNSMTQNQSPEYERVAVRVLVDDKQTRLTSDIGPPEDIIALVDKTIYAAKLLDKEEDLLSLSGAPAPDLNAKVSRFDEKTALFSPQDRANIVQQIVRTAKKHNVEAAGTCVSGERSLAIGNSQNTFVFHKESAAEISITMTAPNSSGWVKENAVSIDLLNPQALAEKAAEKAIKSKDPIDLEPGHYAVILEPSAVLDLLCFLWFDFSATSHIDKLSCLLNQQGHAVFGKEITITDDCAHPLQSGEPFDGEGLPRQKVTLVSNGTFQNMVLGRKSAHQLHLPATGHGLPQPDGYGEYATNVVVSGGNTSLEQMIANSERAIYLTRVWYVREVDPRTKLLTGVTQDGTFLIEKGSLKTGIKNMRFNISLIDLLNNVVALGPAVRAAGEEGSPAVVPAMHINDFNFTERSLF
jgi:PmbA protein